VNEGVIYIATNQRALNEANTSAELLRGDYRIIGTDWKDSGAIPPGLNPEQASRWYKTNLYNQSRYKYTLYLDADTRPRGDYRWMFQALASGWDLLISFSAQQADECLWHISEDEREFTYQSIGYVPLQWQCGVMAFRKHARVRRLFELWHTEWNIYRGQDQAAFLRALYQQPVKLWILGRPWNGGAMINHLYGRCR